MKDGRGSLRVLAKINTFFEVTHLNLFKIWGKLYYIEYLF